jgi:hypothetical protein
VGKGERLPVDGGDLPQWAIDNGAPWENHLNLILRQVRGTDAEGWYREILSQHGY